MLILGFTEFIIIALLLGLVIGLVAAWFMRKGGHRCQSCKKKIPQGANVCPYCGERL